MITVRAPASTKRAPEPKDTLAWLHLSEASLASRQYNQLSATQIEDL
jgi:hypothetical protein